MTPEDVVVAVGQFTDERRWNDLKELFAEELTLAYGDPERISRSDLIDRWRPIFSSYDRTRHVISDVSLMIDGDRADSICEFETTFWMEAIPGGETWTRRGEIIHKLQRFGEQWRITEMRMIPLEAEGNAELPRLAKQEAGARSKAMTRRRNRQVIDSFFSALENRDVDAFRNVWHATARQEMPFAPDGFPDVLDGKADITSHYARWLAELRNLHFNRSVIDTLDPGNFVVIYTGDYNHEAGTGHVHSHYLGFFNITDGKITTLTEYANPDTLRSVARARLHGSDDRRPPTLAPPPSR